MGLKEVFLTLYWSEGTKKQAGPGGSRVEFVSMDPDAINLFLRGLNELYTINKTRLRARIKLHKNMSYVASLDYWSDVTGIPPSQFIRPIIVKRNSDSPDPTNTVLTVRYNSATLFRQIMVDIKKMVAKLE